MAQYEVVYNSADELKKQLKTRVYNQELAIEKYNAIIIEISGLIKDKDLRAIIYNKYLIT